MPLNSFNNINFNLGARNTTAPAFNSFSRGVNRVATNSTTAASKVKRSWEGAFPALIALGAIRQLSVGIGAIIKPSLELNDAMRKMAFAADITDVKMDNLTGSAKKFFDELEKRATPSAKRMYALQASVGETSAAFDAFAERAIPAMRIIARYSGFDVPKLADAFTEMSKKGLGGATAMKMLKTAAELSTIANTDLNESVEIATTLYHVWKVGANDMTMRLGQLAYAALKSRLDLSELKDVVTSAAAGVGIAVPTFENFVMAMTLTRNVSKSATITGHQMKVVLTRLFDGVQTLGREFEILTHVTVNQKKQMRDLDDIMWDLLKVSQKTPESINRIKSIFKEIAGMRGMIPLFAVWQEGQKIINNTSLTLKEAEQQFKSMTREQALLKKANIDYIQALFKTYTKGNLNFQIKQLNVEFRILARTMGELFLPIISRLVRNLTLAARGIGYVTRFLGDLAASSMIVEGFVSALQGVVVALGILATQKAVLYLLAAAWRFVVGTTASATTATAGLTGATMSQITAEQGAIVVIGERILAERALAAAISQRAMAAVGAATGGGVLSTMIGGTAISNLVPVQKVGVFSRMWGKVVGGLTAAAAGFASFGRRIPLLGKVASIIMSVFRKTPWGKILTFAPALAAVFAMWSDWNPFARSQEELEKEIFNNVMLSTNNLQKAAEELEKMGNFAAAKLLKAAGDFKAMTEEDPAIFDKKAFDRMGALITKFQQTMPDFAKKFPKLDELYKGAADVSSKIVSDVIAGKEISQALMAEYANAFLPVLSTLRLGFKGYKGSDRKKIGEELKQVTQESKGFVTESTPMMYGAALAAGMKLKKAPSELTRIDEQERAIKERSIGATEKLTTAIQDAVGELQPIIDASKKSGPMLYKSHEDRALHAPGDIHGTGLDIALTALNTGISNMVKMFSTGDATVKVNNIGGTLSDENENNNDGQGSNAFSFYPSMSDMTPF